MILEMAADALGDRLAYGTRADGLSYEDLRAAARTIADRVDGTGAERLAVMEPNAPIVPATLFGAALDRRQGHQRARVPRLARRPRGAPLHQRHVGRAEGRHPRARPAPRLHL